MIGSVSHWLVRCAAADARCDNRIMQHPLADHDLYCLLGVHPAASAEEIRLAYRQRAMMWHPDRNNRTDARRCSSLSVPRTTSCAIRLAAPTTIATRRRVP